MHSACCAAPAARARRGVDQRPHHWRPPRHSRQSASRPPVGAARVLRTAGQRPECREGLGASRQPDGLGNRQASRLRAPSTRPGTFPQARQPPRSSGEVAGVALHCLKLLLSLANNWSCPARRRERRAVASFSGEPQRHPSRPLAPLQQLRPHHSGSRPRGEQEEEQAHEPKSVTGRFDVRISFFRFPRNFRVYPPPHSSQSTVD